MLFWRILLLGTTEIVLCPDRDNILVDRMYTKTNPRAFRYDI